MKRTQWIELYKRITENKVSFIAIIMFVTFGIAIFAGLSWSGIAISTSIDNELERCNFHDYEVMFAVPVSEESIEAFTQKAGISAAEGGNIFYRSFELRGKQTQAKIESVTTDINKLSQIEGRLPENAEEIVVEKNWAEKNAIDIGDKISFSPEGMFSVLKHDEFTVCGLAESPEYISAIAASYETSSATGTPIDCIMFVHKDAFNMNLLRGYSKLLVKSAQSSEEVELIIKEVFGNDAVYTLFTVSNNASISISKVIIDMFAQLKVNMALMFLVIGILVCFSSASRLVYKDIKLIGTKKSLGFYKMDITVSYLLYAGVASFIGCVLGISLARFAIEPLFLSVLNNTYLFEIPVFYFSISDALLLSAAEIICTGISAYIACASTIKMNTVVLLSGGEPPKIKAKWFERLSLWQRTSLFTKCIVNNLITDSRRVSATLIGIAGCTALIICGITFNNSVKNSFNYQFEHIQDYKGIIIYDPSREDASVNISGLLDKKGIRYSDLYSSAVRLKTPDGGSLVASLNVGNADFDKMFSVYSQDNQLHSVNEGVWLSCAFANNYGIEKGDTVTFIDTAAVEHSAIVDGVFEYYLQCPRIIFSEEAYKKVFGCEAVFNTFFIDICGAELEALSEELENTNGYVGCSDYYATMSGSFSILSGVSSALAYLYIVLAVLMAVFILLDLFVMFVDEKKRELITLMINGYSKKHARKYIYKDTVLLTAIGIILGVLIGIAMGHIIITSMNSDESYFLNNVNYAACLISITTTALLTFIMTKIALKRIDSFSLSDLNK